MILFKACPRCQGDIVQEDLRYDGPYCLQCGYRLVVIPNDVMAEFDALLKGNRTTDYYRRKRQGKKQVMV